MAYTWVPSIKHYPHFDKSIRPSDIWKLVRNPDRVAANAFYPFLKYEKRWQPFRGSEFDKAVSGFQKPEKKEREIRYASRRDSYIYSYYRHMLSGYYENALAANGLSKNVIAYRRVKSSAGRGKSNVEFAYDAFIEIRKLGNCGVVALDISKFFESIDHGILKKQWCSLLGVADLPKDHAAVFRSITSYAVVDRAAAYERLGYVERKIVKGNERLVYTKKFRETPRQLCSNGDFRVKICGQGGAFSKLVRKNEKEYGIPQGSPISDMLANLYLIEFDRAVNQFVINIGGTYYRYSDDILIIVPGGVAEANCARDFAMNEIKKHGDNLLIKDSKTSLLVYKQDGKNQIFERIDGKGRNDLEYLGFRYDGKKIRIRDATISGLYRKISSAAKVVARKQVKRYKNKDLKYLLEKFDHSAFMKRYGRVLDFEVESDYRDWTFWTYAKRSIDTFGALGSPISNQLRNYKRICRSRVESEITKMHK
ncbi:reverse transcriptase domain-containing protein [Inquilinus limosus]|uniref:Reverse transcriptase domain-containing protein n=1 Tax=Inquilinus limosus TaxID=171674 RepID=A0A211YSB3_9PROT|nr:reverse transcriptase domain-containing protein [Inquilinus limosus]OWJ55908.1 hypothetical protein BWR60_35635 [Inquilinus limosus]